MNRKLRRQKNNRWGQEPLSGGEEQLPVSGGRLPLGCCVGRIPSSVLPCALSPDCCVYAVVKDVLYRGCAGGVSGVPQASLRSKDHCTCCSRFMESTMQISSMM